MAPSSKANRLSLIRGYLETHAESTDSLDKIGPAGPPDIANENVRVVLQENLKKVTDSLITYDKFIKLLATPPPVFEDDEEKSDEKESWNHYRRELVQLAGTNWGIAHLKADQLIDPELSKYCLEQSKKFEAKIPEFTYIPVDLEEAPPLPESLMTSDPESDVTVMADNLKKGKKPKPAKTKLILSGPAVDLVEGQIEADHADGKDADDYDRSNPIFMGNKKLIQLLYVPSHSVPTHKGKVISHSQLSNVPLAEVEWVQNDDEKYYDVATLDTAVVSLLHELNHIPTKVKSILMDKVTDSLVGKPRTIDFATAKLEFGERQCQQARLIKHWALSEKHLKEAKLESKVAFIDKWMSRLADVPESLDPSAPSFLLAKFIKQAKGNKTSINKTFYGFLAGNLANWKVGETRDAMIERNKKSLNAYWGSQAPIYIKEFLGTDDGKLIIKPAPAPMTRRLAKLAKVAEQRGWKAYSEVTAGLNALTEEAKQEFVEAQVISTGLPFRQRAKVYWSRMANFGGKVRSLAKPTTSTVFTKIGSVLDELTDNVYRLVSGSSTEVTGNGLIVSTWFKKTTYRFKKAMTKEAPLSWSGLRSVIRNSGSDDFSIIVEDRQWWGSVKSTASKMAWAVAAPIRWFGAQFNHSLGGEDDKTEGGTE